MVCPPQPPNKPPGDGLNQRPPESEVTQLLQAVDDGKQGATDELLKVVYGELRRLAATHMRREPVGHTLQPTALVHEAYIRLVGGAGSQWSSRAHFFGAAAQAMRRILVERHRRVTSSKRGGERKTGGRPGSGCRRHAGGAQRRFGPFGPG